MLNTENKSMLVQLSKIVKLPIKINLYNDRLIAWDLNDSRYLYGHGYFGKPIGVDKPKFIEFEAPLELSYYEAIYLLKLGWIEVIETNKNEIVGLEELFKRGSSIFYNFQKKYIVYEDLRRLGYIVRPGMKFGVDFVVYEYGPGIDHSPFMVDVLEHETDLNPIELVRAGRLATTVKKKFVIAAVSGDVPHYYVFTRFKP